MNIFRHIVGIASELFTQRDPYDKYTPPQLISEHRDRRGNTHQIIRASNHADATRHAESVAGKSVVATRISANTWDVHTE